MKYHRVNVTVQMTISCENDMDVNDVMSEVTCEMSTNYEGAEVTDTPEIVIWQAFLMEKEI